jgi:phage terminase small subunit
MTKRSKVNAADLSRASGLTPKQERFAVEYLKDGNATQAAIRAGYSAANADVTGPRLLGNVGIAAAIEAGREKIMAKLEISTQRVLERFERWAAADPRKAFDAGGQLLHPSAMDEATAATVAEVEVTKRAGGEALHKIKFVDRLAANVALARSLGMFRDNVDVSIRPGLAEALDAAWKRVGRQGRV